MRQVSIDNVVPGMVSARHVYAAGDTGGVPLVAANVVISEALRERLRRARIETVPIDDDLSHGIEPRPPITDEIRQSAVVTVRDTLADIRANKDTISHEQMASVETTISSIISEISGRRNLLIALSDLNIFGGDLMHHAVNVCVVGCAIGRHYLNEHGWVDYRGQRRQDGIDDRLQKLGIGLLLQDVGALAVPDEIWQKHGMLTASERKIMQQHPLFGVEMLKGSDLSPLTTVAVSQHHERFDGSGYPRGLAGDEIHEHGQIAGIAEAFTSLSSISRNGRPPTPAHQAYAMILQAGGRLFHPTMVDAFAHTVAPYGAGTTVRLSDGRHGIVVSNTPDRPLAPVVRLTHDAAGVALAAPVQISLARTDHLDIVEVTGDLPQDRAASPADG